MQALKTVSLNVDDEAAMSAFGKRLSAVLGAGDTVLLEGPIGAGKSHLARSIIGALLDQPEDIPSPTFTLVQTYQAADFEIWHTDLYRLGDSSELVELGLDEAIGEALVLIEWPDRLPTQMVPIDALDIVIAPQGVARKVACRAVSQRWASTIESFADV